MSTTNLEQLRAANAYQAAQDKIFANEEGGQVVKKIPALIRTSGLLATLAFSIEKGAGFAEAMRAILRHLQTGPSARFTNISAESASALEDWLSALTGEAFTSSELMEVISEIDAFLVYFRRFASKEAS